MASRFGLWAMGMALACGFAAGRTVAAPAAPSALAAPVTPELRPVLEQYAVLAHATYSDTLTLARALQQAVAQLLAAPSPAALAAARVAWVDARGTYALTEAFRFYGGPIDGSDGPEPRLNAWPVDESFIDGLIADAAQPLDATALAQANTRGGEENVSTGWHAVEYLLWGPDLRADGPGDRSYTDYVEAASPQAARRRDYLRHVTALLVADLAGLERAWAPGRDNYRRGFEDAGAEGLRRLIVGLGSLSRAELAGERLEVPLASRDQEDEQSCFSDNTHADVVGDAQGIQNVWQGRYRQLDGRWLEGPSLKALVATHDAALADRLDAGIAASLAAAEAIVPPFDQEILGGRDAPGRQRVQRTIDALVRQAALLVEAARGLGIQQLHWVRKP